MILLVFLLRSFRSANDLRGNVKGFAYGNDFGGSRGITENFHAMPHVVNAKHFLGAGATCFPDGFKNRRDRHQVVFDVMNPGTKAQALGLATAGAVNHPVDMRTMFVQKLFDRGIVARKFSEEINDL